MSEAEVGELVEMIPMSTTPTDRPSKGERTRGAIIDAALGLFEERGYDATTMRAIAERAGVSVGNAYYYFGSKEHLVQGFYDRAATAHLAASHDRLVDRTDLAERIYHHLDAWFDVLGGYHQFAAQFFRTAADPASPMSPFSAESGPARDAAVARWREVIDGSDADIPDDLAAELPNLLWVFQMGIVLFWVYDQSPDQIATRLAIGRTAPLVTKLIGLADVPQLSDLLDDILGLVADARRANG